MKIFIPRDRVARMTLAPALAIGLLGGAVWAAPHLTRAGQEAAGNVANVGSPAANNVGSPSVVQAGSLGGLPSPLAQNAPAGATGSIPGLDVNCTGGSDNPHYSRHAGQQGQDMINAKFWTQCSATVAAITAEGQLQQQIAGVWVPVAFTDPSVETHANTNYTYSTAAVACTSGTFRGAGAHSATDYSGNNGVAVTTSNQVTNPCP